MFQFRENRFITYQNFLQLVHPFFFYLYGISQTLDGGMMMMIDIWLFYSIYGWALGHYATATITYSKQIDQLWVSTLTTTNCEKNFPSWLMIIAVIDVCKYRCLEESLTEKKYQLLSHWFLWPSQPWIFALTLVSNVSSLLWSRS